MSEFRVPRPWLRTLPDDETAVAAELIACTRDVICGEMGNVDVARAGSFPISLKMHGQAAAIARVLWYHGCLEVTLEGVSGTDPFVDRHGQCFTKVEVADTPSVAETASPIVSIQSITDRLDYWLVGLQSPYQTVPVQLTERVSRFLDRLAIAVERSEPDWHWLYVEPCRRGLDRVITLVFDGFVKDIGIGTGSPEHELHPELAADIRDLTNHYTEVRQNSFRHDADIRVHIGDGGVIQIKQLNTVDKLRLHARCHDDLTLYA